MGPESRERKAIGGRLRRHGPDGGRGGGGSAGSHGIRAETDRVGVCRDGTRDAMDRRIRCLRVRLGRRVDRITTPRRPLMRIECRIRPGQRRAHGLQPGLMQEATISGGGRTGKPRTAAIAICGDRECPVWFVRLCTGKGRASVSYGRARVRGGVAVRIPRRGRRAVAPGGYPRRGRSNRDDTAGGGIVSRAPACLRPCL